MCPVAFIPSLPLSGPRPCSVVPRSPRPRSFIPSTMCTSADADLQPNPLYEPSVSASSSSSSKRPLLPKSVAAAILPGMSSYRRPPRRSSSASSPLDDIDDPVVIDNNPVLNTLLPDSHVTSPDLSESVRTETASFAHLSAGLFQQPAPPTSSPTNPRTPPQQISPPKSLASLSNTLSSIRRRRSRLSRETAADTLPPLITTDTPKQAKEPLETIHQQLTQTLLQVSLADALPVLQPPPSHLADQLTSQSIQLSSLSTQPPFVQTPFLALHEAHVRLANPPCPRCSSPANDAELNAHRGVCEACYTNIYLATTPTNRDPLDGVPPHLHNSYNDDRRLEQQAQSIIASASAADSSQPPAQSVPSSRPASRPASSPSGGNAADGSSRGSGTGDAYSVEASFVDGWKVVPSQRSLRTINPIRNLVQNITVVPNPEKTPIKLSVGDPTTYGNLSVSSKIIDTFCDTLRAAKSNGYSLSMGNLDARTAVAARYSTTTSPLSPDDVLLSGGTSGALELALGALANEGDNVLLPRPGFPLFQTLAEGFGIECRYYNLLPDQDWQVQLSHLSTLVDDRTRALVVNNPSNPCGSVFPEDHVRDIIEVASALRLPIIADEVYADMTFGNTPFLSFGEASTDVPTLVVGGVSKQFVVPGWRLGWVLVHDRADVFQRTGVRKGLRQLTTRMMTPNTPAQTVLPAMLEDHEGFREIMAQLEGNSSFAMECLEKVSAMSCSSPRGAMYMMAKVDVERMGLKDDMEFVERLYEEEAVFLLPGQCFQAKNFVRIVFSPPKEVLKEAFGRIQAFCERRMEKNGTM